MRRYKLIAVLVALAALPGCWASCGDGRGRPGPHRGGSSVPVFNVAPR